MQNLFDLPQIPLSEELTTILSENGSIRIERIISSGQTTDWLDQDEWEFVALLQGSANLEYVGGSMDALSSGDTVIIPPHKLHRVAFTSKYPCCIWLCVFWKSSVYQSE